MVTATLPRFILFFCVYVGANGHFGFRESGRGARRRKIGNQRDDHRGRIDVEKKTKREHCYMYTSNNKVFGVGQVRLGDFDYLLCYPGVLVYLLTLGSLAATSSTDRLNTMSLSLTSRLMNGPLLTTIQK